MRTHSILHWLLSGMLVLLWLPLPALAEEGGLLLSPTQAAWLRAHPTVTVGLYDNDWPPFERVRDGKAEGLAHDYLTEAAARLGVTLTSRRYSSWTEVLRAACAGEIDVVMDVVLTAERTRCLVFSRQYAEAPVALVTRLQDGRASREPELAGLRVVTERDFALSAVTRERYPEATHLEADGTLAALRMVSDGQADVYVGNAYVASALIAEAEIARVGLLRQTDLPLDSLHFGVPNAKQPLAEALDAALAAIPEANDHAIRNRWLAPLHWQGSGTMVFTADEQAVLAQQLKLGFAPSWAPISFLDEEGQPSGVAGDYLNRFRTAGAGKLQTVRLESWQAIRNAMRDGQLDAVLGVPNDTSVLGAGWVFSQPFLTMSNVIVVGDGAGRVLNMGDLRGHRVALSDPERLGPLLRAQAPDAIQVPVAAALDGLEQVRSGKAYAYIGNLAVVDRYLRDRYSGELHVAAPAGVEDRLSLAVRKQHAALAMAFDRMLLSMTPREREAIRTDWLAVEYRADFDWGEFLKWALPLALILLTAGLMHAIGHVRLRREVEQRRRVERRLEEVTGNLPAVVYQARRAPDGSFSFPFIAGDMPSLFGISVEQATDNERALFDRVHPEDQSRLAEELERAAAVFDGIAIDFRAMAGEDWRWIRSRGQPSRADDGYVQWSGYWIDVTDTRAQKEALVAAKAAAEQAAETKANFLATMSHEIRTPMSGVLGMLEMLSHTRLDGEQRRVLAIIGDSAQMLRQILDDILDFSKMEAGALQLEATPVSLHRVVDNIQRMLSTQATAKGLRLGNRIDPRIALRYAADGVRLRQILFNLLSNAIKFTPQGEVAIELDLLDSRADAQRIRLAVRDTGVGIAEDQHERLFSPFIQAEASTTRRYGGTGLGLSICRKLAELMGGELTLHSAPGQGTRVELDVWLPVSDEDDEAPDDMALTNAADGAADAVPLPPAWRGRRVLIVEDHPTNQDLMRWRMQQLGLSHEVVEDGQAALDALAQSLFDLVITDCRMPGMDGYTFTRELRRREAAKPTAKRMPIIALTASALEEEARRCREAGMDDFLAKPVPLSVLRETLLRWLPATGGGSTADDAPSAKPTESAELTSQVDDAPANAGAPPSPTRSDLIARFGSTDLVERMVDSLQAATRGDLAALDAAIAAGDPAGCGDGLHRIAGGLGAIGAGELARAGRTLQEAVERDGVTAHLEDLRAFRTALETCLTRLLA